MKKKDQIVSTVLRLIAERGIHDTPMSLIAKESGVATGTIYHHYKSKNEIMNDIYQNNNVEYGRIIRKSLDGEDSVRDQFFNLWVNLFQYYMNNPMMFVFVEQVTRTPIISEESKVKGYEQLEPAFEYFQNCIKKGVFIDVNIYVIMNLLHGNIISMVQLCLDEKIEISEREIQEAIEMSWRAISK